MIRLRTGHYLSPVGATRRAAAATLVETTYASGDRLPPHAHDFPYLVLMIDGCLRERIQGRCHDLVRGSIVFNRAGEVHEDLVLSPSTRCLNVELRPEFIGAMDDEGLHPRDSVLYTHAGASVGAIGRLYASVIDPGSDVEVEEALVELFIALTAKSSARSRGHAWVERVLELIHAGLPDRPTLGDLARHAGVQQAHLCRGFRAEMNCTIGQYIRAWRTARALAGVTAGGALAATASTSGFADQAHMTRAFSREYRRSPGRLARAAQSSFKTTRPG